MLICCPECQFERTIDETAIPANAAVATCPRCQCRFRFRAPDGSPIDPGERLTPPSESSEPLIAAAAETSPQTSTEDVAAQEAPSASAMDSTAADENQGDTPSSTDPDDDPLPPGAVVPRISDANLEDDSTVRKEEPPVKKSWKDSFGKSEKKAEPSALKENLDKAKQRLLGQDGAALSQHEANVSVPWEQPRRYGTLLGLYYTILRVMFNAPRFYAGLTSASSGIGRPLLFYLILGIFQVLVKRMWFLMSLQAVSPTVSDPQVQEMIGALTDSMSLPLTLITAPVIIVAQIFFFTSIFFLMIRLVQPDSAHFLTIFRVVAYSAAPTVICIVPFVGQIVGSIWFAVCCFIGCKYAMRLPWSRVGLALGPPYLVALAIGVQIAQRMMMGG